MISSTKSTLCSFLLVLLHEPLQLCESHRAVTRMGWGVVELGDVSRQHEILLSTPPLQTESR